MEGCVAAAVLGGVIVLLAVLAKGGVALLGGLLWNWTTYRGRGIPAEVVAAEGHVPRDVLSGGRQLLPLGLLVIAGGGIVACLGNSVDSEAVGKLGMGVALVPTFLIAFAVIYEALTQNKSPGEETNRRRKQVKARRERIARLDERIAAGEEAAPVLELFRRYWRACLELENLEDAVFLGQAPDPEGIARVESDLEVFAGRIGDDRVLRKRWKKESRRLAQVEEGARAAAAKA